MIIGVVSIALSIWNEARKAQEQKAREERERELEKLRMQEWNEKMEEEQREKGKVKQRKKEKVKEKLDTLSNDITFAKKSLEAENMLVLICWRQYSEAFKIYKCI